ncbi:unnamed protein product, partial [Ixodes pacificus]
QSRRLLKRPNNVATQQWPSRLSLKIRQKSTIWRFPQRQGWMVPVATAPWQLLLSRRSHRNMLSRTKSLAAILYPLNQSQNITRKFGN